MLCDRLERRLLAKTTEPQQQRKPMTSLRTPGVAKPRKDASRKPGWLWLHDAPRNTRYVFTELYQSSHHCHTLPPILYNPFLFAAKLPTGLVRGYPSLYPWITGQPSGSFLILASSPQQLPDPDGGGHFVPHG